MLARGTTPGLELNGPISSMTIGTEVSWPGAKIQLQELGVSAGALLMLHISDYPRLDVKKGALAGRIEANKARLYLTNPHGSKDLPVQGLVPETLNFTTRHSSTAPAQLMLETTQSWHLDGMLVQELAFAREEPPGSSHWVSTLLNASGKIM